MEREMRCFFLLRIGEKLLGIEKNKGEREMKNQSAGLVFSTSISYIEKKWKKEMRRSICWSCSKLFTIYRGV